MTDPTSDAPRPMPTIAALATARGTAALAVVRVSGPEAVSVVASRFSNAGLADADGRTVWVGWLNDADGRRVDQVVCVVWRGPRSSTGEDVVEVTCHGGDAVARAVLRVLFEAGARPAEPGEFTQRAFLNGKLDLAQAEAVADLVHAESALGHRAAVSALRGGVSEAVGAVRERLVQTAALVELELDFAEEDVAFADRSDLRALLDDADRELERLVGTARLGALARDGVRAVIGGRPNAGKSTLLNALVGEDRAITSPTAGTTRDAVEAAAEIGGLRFSFVDTAGLRDTADAIEAEGTRRAHAAIDGADVLLYVVDATVGPDDEERGFLSELSKRRPELPVVTVWNKADLERRNAEGGTQAQRADHGITDEVPPPHLRRGTGGGLRPTSALRDGPSADPPLSPPSPEGGGLRLRLGDGAVPHPVHPPAGERGPGLGAGEVGVGVSALYALSDPAALDGLRTALLDAVRAGGLNDPGAGLVAVNERHRAHLADARAAVGRARASLDAGDGGDTLALDLRAALHALGLVTGAVTTEHVLDAVFSQFCIGK